MADLISSQNDPALVALSSTVLIEAQPGIAKAKQFATDFSADAVPASTTLKIPVLGAGNAAAVFDDDTNNYATGDGALSFASITFDQYVKSFNFTDSQLANVPRSLFDECGKVGGIALGQAMMAALMTAIKTGTLTGTAKTLPAVGTFAKADLATLSGQAITDASRCVLALSKAYFGKALSFFDADVYGGTEAIRSGVLDGGAYGFKSIIQLEGALPTNTIGLIIPENAVAVATRNVPVESTRAYDAVESFTDEASGFTVQLRKGCDFKTGRNSVAVTAMIGAGVTQGAKIQKITVAS